MKYDIQEYLHTTREHFASYHDHKEQMAFAATGLYIGGVTAFIAQENFDWVKEAVWLWVFLAGVLAITTFLFVWWQLSIREYAAKVVEACDNIRTLWLSSLPEKPEVNATTYEGKIMPQVLAGELAVVAQNKTENFRRKKPKLLTCGIIVLWSIFLVLRIWYSMN